MQLKLENHIRQKDDQINYLNNVIAQKDQKITLLTNQLNTVLGTFRWRLMQKFYDFCFRTRLIYPIKFLLNIKRNYYKNIANQSHGSKSEVININQTKDFNPYEQIELLKEIEVMVIEEDFRDKDYPPFSLAVTIFNEESGIIDFLKSIEVQSVKPTEVILVDGGSKDKTVKKIKDHKENSSLNIRLIEGSNLNIPQGRNIAIKYTKNEIIVLADAGTILDKNYCKNLVGCFDKFKKVDLVGGIYHPFKKTQYNQYFIPNWYELDWNMFLPSTRSMALRKSLVEKVGYYPEYLKTGDDTLFDINYRKNSKRWVFNKKAYVRWDCPKTKIQYLKLAQSYGRGDGESGIGDFFYYDPLKRIEFYKGYLLGKKNRVEKEIKFRKIKGVKIFFSDEPINSNKNIKVLDKIKKLIKTNYKVIFVNRNPTIVDPFKKAYLDLDSTLLELYYTQDFNIDQVYKDYKYHGKPISIIK